MAKSITSLYLAKHIRSFEKKACEELNLTENELMSRAGQAAFSLLGKYYPHVQSIAIFCGGGNNGGDGYVLATLAKQNGLNVVVYQHHDIEDLPPAAHHAATTALEAGVVVQTFDEGLIQDTDLIVDALLGIGLEGNVREPLVQVINLMNESDVPILSLDIPSGLHTDTGNIMGVCVQANVTLTFIAPKIGLYQVNGPDYCGKIICDTLGLDDYLSEIKPDAIELHRSLFVSEIKPRIKNAYKGLFGHILIIGGGKGMPGAAYLASAAALRIGAGLVTIATHPMYANQSLPGLPEVMVVGIDHPNDLSALLAKATVCVLGPGLGDDEWAKQLFFTTIASHLPLVIDASALGLLAHHAQYDDHWILTPHPGEAAQLLNCSTHHIQENRLDAAKSIQKQYGGHVVLKGLGSLIYTSEQQTYLCSAGNPGMATAGMGDVLSGVIGGLIGQGLSLTKAAQLGVWIHATAADKAVKHQGERGLLASDLMPYLRQEINLLAQEH